MNKIYVKNLFYCPVKSLSFSETKSLSIINNLGIKNDRFIAFTRGLNKISSKKFNNSKDRNLNFFLTLKNSPYLKKYNFIFDDKDKIIKLYKNKKFLIECNIHNEIEVSKIEKFIENIDVKIKKPIFLIFNNKIPFFDTTPNISVSMININTIKDLENKLNMKIEYERFRGNVLIDNLNAWDEFKYLDKIINIGEVNFKVDAKIPRCSATNINPKSYKLDINLPNSLMKLYGHKDLGVYLIPQNSGLIKTYDKVILS
tara:strand:+ start:240 stop:1010 length:771 start_codon:yes stop_codon:yes gene_type:complete